MPPNPVAGFACGLIAFGLWAIHDAVIKALGPVLPVWQIMFFLNLFWLPFVIVLLIADPAHLSLRPNNPRLLALRSVLSIAVSMPIFYAFTVLPLAETYAILFSTPLWITALSGPMLGEKVGWRRWAAVIVGFIGVMIVLRPGVTVPTFGHLSALVGAFFAAIVFMMMRRLRRDESPGVMMLYPVLVNLVVLPGFMVAFGFAPMTGPVLAGTAVLAFLGFAGTVALLAGYRRTDAAMIAPAQYSQILWASALGAMFFGENLSWNVAAGAVLIVGSGIYITLREYRLSRGT